MAYDPILQGEGTVILRINKNYNLRKLFKIEERIATHFQTENPSHSKYERSTYIDDDLEIDGYTSTSAGTKAQFIINHPFLVHGLAETISKSKKEGKINLSELREIKDVLPFCYECRFQGENAQQEADYLRENVPELETIILNKKSYKTKN